ncbi:LysR family transcriptional regulator [Labedaea rhizosphaerae]|uniref:LysR family transcriptional regulator n=1 Tax=Labedaea rhizosphaerae TaxID=598644 RepID=A0A4R6S9V7_LABRH|nr:LysR substrate-binding domain-containing protein [Labedaea rhizosphaerae]TDP96680.1 LysR family transcriptional regulator [Labedaea rhizosphaerae]
MELRQLEYFVAVVEEANFTRAAARVHVAQPGVSAQIRRLERELGHELLDRSGRGVRPTEVGAAVLPYARAALAAVESARLAADEMGGLVRGHLAVGMITSHTVDLPSLLADFHERYPAVEITLTEGESAHLLDDIRTGALDAAIVAVGAQDPDGVALRTITDEAIDAAVALDHPLAGAKSIPLLDLRDHPLITMRPGTGIRSHLESACAATGFTPHVAFEAGTPQLLAQLAVRGLGVAVLPTSIAHNHPGLHPLVITDPSLRGRVALAWRSPGPLNPAARAFLPLFDRN